MRPARIATRRRCGRGSIAGRENKKAGTNPGWRRAMSAAVVLLKFRNPKLEIRNNDGMFKRGISKRKASPFWSFPPSVIRICFEIPIGCSSGPGPVERRASRFEFSRHAFGVGREQFAGADLGASGFKWKCGQALTVKVSAYVQPLGEIPCRRSVETSRDVNRARSTGKYGEVSTQIFHFRHFASVFSPGSDVSRSSHGESGRKSFFFQRFRAPVRLRRMSFPLRNITDFTRRSSLGRKLDYRRSTGSGPEQKPKGSSP